MVEASGAAQGGIRPSIIKKPDAGATFAIVSVALDQFHKEMVPVLEKSIQVSALSDLGECAKKLDQLVRRLIEATNHHTDDSRPGGVPLDQMLDPDAQDLVNVSKTLHQLGLESAEMLMKRDLADGSFSRPEVLPTSTAWDWDSAHEMLLDLKIQQHVLSFFLKHPNEMGQSSAQLARNICSDGRDALPAKVKELLKAMQGSEEQLREEVSGYIDSLKNAAAWIKANRDGQDPSTQPDMFQLADAKPTSVNEIRQKAKECFKSLVDKIWSEGPLDVRKKRPEYAESAAFEVIRYYEEKALDRYIKELTGEQTVDREGIYAGFNNDLSVFKFAFEEAWAGKADDNQRAASERLQVLLKPETLTAVRQELQNKIIAHSEELLKRDLEGIRAVLSNTASDNEALKGCESLYRKVVQHDPELLEVVLELHIQQQVRSFFRSIQRQCVRIVNLLLMKFSPRRQIRCSTPGQKSCYRLWVAPMSS